MKSSFYDHNYQELHQRFLAQEINPKALNLIFSHHYKEKKINPCTHHNLSKKAQEYIQSNFDFDLPEIEEVHEASDLTVKFLIKLKDNSKIESVLIPFQSKYTLCLSTQVGCAMKCSFCFTGTQGLKRNLSTAEIIGQYILAWNWLNTHRPKDHLLKNLVYMGQGEPLHNFDSVKKANQIFIDQHGASIGIQKITISTAGYLPGLKRWIEEMPGVNLALSLHAVNEEKRNQLIPINVKYPLDEILQYIDTIPLARKQYITYEYLLVKDFNDFSEDAHLLGKLLKGKAAIINLIPFNPFPGALYKKPDKAAIKNFKAIIEGYNLPALIRTTKGDEVLAACGQLNTKVKSVINL